MKFIIWFAVYWGLTEISYWRFYHYRGQKWIDEAARYIIWVSIAQTIMFLTCYKLFI